MDARAVIRCGIVPRFRIGMDAAVTGWKPEGVAKDGFIHLINSGATRRDARAVIRCGIVPRFRIGMDAAGTGKQKKDGKPAMKPYWEISAKEAGDCLDATSWRYADLGYFRGGGYSSDFLTCWSPDAARMDARAV
jgi:L-fucose isomerase